MKQYGLIGNPLTHSFSKMYFEEKFEKERLFDHTYELFPISTVGKLRELLQKNLDLKGFNVTIPYKEQVIPFLDAIDDVAREIGAVNTVKINSGKLIGYNTDVYGFRKSLLRFFNQYKTNYRPEKALLLGTGGAAKAVAYVLKELKIDYVFVSRNEKNGYICYSDISGKVMRDHQLIVNTTPLGMYPGILRYPNIPYHLLSEEHLLFDLIYNPDETAFMKFGKSAGCSVKNGLEMLHFQADRAWEIWTS